MENDGEIQWTFKNNRIMWQCVQVY